MRIVGAILALAGILVLAAYGLYYAFRNFFGDPDIPLAIRLAVPSVAPDVSCLGTIQECKGGDFQGDGHMIVVTSDQIEGRRILRTIGLVRGSSIRARHVGKDILAILRSIVGGEITEYTKLMAESREQALQRMVAEAESVGANAIVGTRFVTSMVMSGAADLLVYGTAVVVE